jgi:molybdopterin converting factor small subunit
MLNTIYLQTFSWINDALGIRGNTSHTVVKKVAAGATLLTVFADLARDYPEFKKLVYNPDSGQLSDQVLLLINQNLSRFDQVKASPLNDKDAISLVPVIFGG